MALTNRQISAIKKDVNFETDRLPQIFNAVSDPTRCRIFRLLLVLKNQDISVTDLAHIVGISVPAISQQIKIMNTAGLVKKEKKGQTAYYRICNDDPLVKSVVNIINKTDKRR